MLWSLSEVGHQGGPSGCGPYFLSWALLDECSCNQKSQSPIRTTMQSLLASMSSQSSWPCSSGTANQETFSLKVLFHQDILSQPQEKKPIQKLVPSVRTIDGENLTMQFWGLWQCLLPGMENLVLLGHKSLSVLEAELSAAFGGHSATRPLRKLWAVDTQLMTFHRRTKNLPGSKQTPAIHMIFWPRVCLHYAHVLRS